MLHGKLVRRPARLRLARPTCGCRSLIRNGGLRAASLKRRRSRLADPDEGDIELVPHLVEVLGQRADPDVPVTEEYLVDGGAPDVEAPCEVALRLGA